MIGTGFIIYLYISLPYHIFCTLHFRLCYILLIDMKLILDIIMQFHKIVE